MLRFLVFSFAGSRMELFDAIDTRSSAGRLTAPGPSPEQLDRLLRAAERAPDHGRIRPWRFIVLDGAVRENFATAAAAAKRIRLPLLTEEQLAAERDKILRSPNIVVAACVADRANTKVPEIEQVIAVGAAVENLFLAAHGLGYGVMWKTGAAAYDPAVKALLGLQASDHIVAILHLGTRVK
jgi:nitroreductase